MKKTTHYTGHRWTNAELETLMRMWAADATLAEIASALSATEHAISHQVTRMRKNGIPLKRRTSGHMKGRSWQLWTPEEVEYLIRRREAKDTAEQIAADMGRSFLGVQGMIQKLRKEGVPVPMRGNGVRRLWCPNKLRESIAGRGMLPSAVIEDIA